MSERYVALCCSSYEAYLVVGPGGDVVYVDTGFIHCCFEGCLEGAVRICSDPQWVAEGDHLVTLLVRSSGGAGRCEGLQGSCSCFLECRGHRRCPSGCGLRTAGMLRSFIGHQSAWSGHAGPLARLQASHDMGSTAVYSLWQSVTPWPTVSSVRLALDGQGSCACVEGCSRSQRRP